GPPKEVGYSRIDLITLFLAAFIIRLAWIKFGSWEANDSQWYLNTASNLIHHHLFSADGVLATAYRPPLYSVLIGLLWWGESAPILATLIIQALLGAITVTLVYLTGVKHGGRAAALLAGSGLAIAPMTGRFTAVVLSETLFTFLVALGVFLWSRKRYALTGMAFGLGILTRVTLLPFVVLLPLLSVMRGWRQQRRPYILIACVALAVSSIWMARNAIVFHRFIPVAASGYGTNLLIGSMDVGEADDVVRRKTLLGKVDSGGGVPATEETEFDRMRMRAALNRIKENPVHWLAVRARQYPRLFIDNGSYLFGGDGVPLTQAIYERSVSQVIIRSALVLANLSVFILAAVGVWARRSRLVEFTELWLFPLFLALVGLPLWLEPRYGLPMMPAIAILSAMGAIAVLRSVAGRFTTEN
ncbi:MAG TPA: glycosyltransferase family 39 protein, partial [Pyrinomonadaceae bacterium]|nr:glycosyltransferase family 39 protein [Pyrinomonadaceae bacterium]